MSTATRRLFAAARLAADAIPIAERLDHEHLYDIARAMIRANDPAAIQLVRAMESLGTEHAADVATLYARLGRRADVDRLVANVDTAGLRRQARTALVQTYELLGDTALSDALGAGPWALQAAIERGDRGRIAHFARELATDAASPEAHLQLAELARHIGDPSESLEHVRRADRAWTPREGFDSTSSLAKIASAYVDAGALDDALRVAKKATSPASPASPASTTSPTSRGPRTPRKPRIDYASEAIPILARVCERAGDHEAAVELIERHVTELFELPTFEARAALYFAQIREHEKAEAWFARPFEPPASGDRPYSDDELDGLHAIYAEAALALGDPPRALKHAAYIVAPAQRIAPILAIVQWIEERGAPRSKAFSAAIDKLERAPIPGPPGYQPSYRL